MEIKSEVYGMRSSYHPWAAFRKKHKQETKVDLSFTLILKTNKQCQGSSVSIITKEF